MEIRLLTGAIIEGRKWKLRDMEKLVSATGRGFLPALLKVLEECTIQVIDPGLYRDFSWPKVYEGDLFDALWQWRAASVSEIYGFNVTCGNSRCRQPIKFEFPVSTVRRRPVPDAVLEHLREGENRFDVAWSRGTFTFLIPTAEETIAISNTTARTTSTIRQKGGDVGVARGSSLTDALRQKVLSVTTTEGQTVVGGKLGAFLEDLDMDEAGELLDLIDSMSFGIDTEVEIDCSACGSTMPGEIPLQKSFFLSGGTRAPAVSSLKSEP
jgi:hypothetical protein